MSLDPRRDPVAELTLDHEAAETLYRRLAAILESESGPDSEALERALYALEEALAF